MLGPLPFTVYTADLAAVAEKHAVSLHVDDTQLYLHCRCVDTASAAAQLERCIIDLDVGKPTRAQYRQTELLWAGLRHSLSQQGCCLPMLQLGSDSIAARDQVRLL